MAGLIGRKLLTLVAVMFAVSFITYFLLDLLPGDKAAQILGPQNVSAEGLAAVREEYNLDDPLPVRYVAWISDVVLRQDLGRSYQSRQEVKELILERLPVTLEIAGMALLIALLVSIPLGVLTAYRAGGIGDRAVTGMSFGLLSIPNFMMALLLIYVFAVELDWFPASSWTRLTDDPIRNLKTAFLPAMSLAVAQIAVFTRLLRSDMIATLQEDHVTLARSKGLPTWRILFRHALRPSSFSLLTVAGLQVGALLGGAVVVEQIFALPGMGRLLFDAISQRDPLVVQGVVLFIAGMYVLVNMAIDILYTFLDPRIRKGGARALA